MQTLPITYGPTLANGFLKVTLAAGPGARILSLERTGTGREWLLQEAAPGLRRPRYGDDFSLFHCSGFDDCFPNVAASEGDGHWPDHGELWTADWEVRGGYGETLSCTAKGRAWPYTFTRTLKLEADTLRLDYHLENHASRPFPHLWSAHPLLRAQEGMTVVLPEAVREVMVNWVSDPACGRFGERRPWPSLDGRTDVSRVGSARDGFAAKLFVQDLPEGWASLEDRAAGECLTVSWEPRELPYLGLWLCYGGWPTDGRPGHLTVALEPASGLPDSLEAAARWGLCPTLGPGQSSRWSLRLRAHSL